MDELSKTCRKCGEMLPLSAYSPSKNGRLGRHPRCRPCHNEDQREKYHSDPAWRKHKAEYKLRTHDRNAPYLREWKARNRDMDRGHSAKACAKERAHKYGRTDMVVEDISMQDVRDEYGDQCIYCDGPFEEFDHAIPISRGGHHVLSNVTPVCASCNHSKFTKTPLEFRRMLAGRA